MKIQKKRQIKEVMSWVIHILSAIIIAGIMQSQVFALTTVNQRSMENTLVEGDVLILDKLSYCFKNPKRGDIIVFLEKEETRSVIKRFDIFWRDVKGQFNKTPRNDRLIKRVVAVEGDEIEIRDGIVYVNGIKQSEDYVDTYTPGEVHTVVPEGYIYVLGDNRENSKDSRLFGPISMEKVEGRAVFRLFPLKKFGKI